MVNIRSGVYMSSDELLIIKQWRKFAWKDKVDIFKEEIKLPMVNLDEWTCEGNSNISYTGFILSWNSSVRTWHQCKFRSLKNTKDTGVTECINSPGQTTTRYANYIKKKIIMKTHYAGKWLKWKQVAQLFSRAVLFIHQTHLATKVEPQCLNTKQRWVRMKYCTW